MITLKKAVVVTAISFLLPCLSVAQGEDKNVVRSDRQNGFVRDGGSARINALRQKYFSVSPSRPYYIQPKPRGSVGEYTRYHFRGYPVYPPSEGKYVRRYHTRRVR